MDRDPVAPAVDAFAAVDSLVDVADGGLGCSHAVADLDSAAVVVAAAGGDQAVHPDGGPGSAATEVGSEEAAEEGLRSDGHGMDSMAGIVSLV